MTRLKTCALIVLLLTPFVAPQAEEAYSALDSFRDARRAYDGIRMAAIRNALMERASEERENYEAQIEAAECLRITGSELRTQRQAQRISGQEAKELKALQEDWSTQGMAFAERALALATTDERIARTHRVYGELYANSITGMVAGLRNGPKARNHMDEAMARTPKDPECMRAMGIMYLNNPPFNGGDVERAIETFSRCHTLVPDNDSYTVLLTLAYKKHKDWTKALEAAETTLRINAANPNAAALKEAIMAKLETSE